MQLVSCTQDKLSTSDSMYMYQFSFEAFGEANVHDFIASYNGTNDL